MIKYNSTQDLFLDLPDTVLLVGNGKINKKAKLINSYEYVIRFNDFEIEDYEYDVGTKVDTISFHSSDFTYPHTSILEKNYLKYNNTCHLFTTSPPLGNSKSDILHPENNSQLLNVFNPIQYNPELRLSSGLSLIINLTLFFNKNVHLIGFDFMQSGHYWDNNFSNAKFWETLGRNIPSHNESFEKELLLKIKTVKFI
jgi:hypothetical protein